MSRDEDYATAPFKPEAKLPFLARTFPITRQLRGYSGKAAGKDLIAGATVAALAIPSAMAYAEVAGLSPVNGLYALLLPIVAYALFGSSRVIVMGPEGALAALIAAAVLPLAASGSAEAEAFGALLALLSGILFLLARVVKLGWIADYLSKPVLVGYIHGVAIVLIIGQLEKLLGIDVSAVNPIPQLIEVFKELGDISASTVLVSLISLAVLFGLRWKWPRFPSALLVVLVAIAASKGFDLASHGVATVGTVPAGLPHLQLPAVSASEIANLLPAAIGMFLVTLADGLLTARAFASMRGETVDASQELMAFGAANVASGLSQGMPVGVSGSRTAVNDGVGAKSQVSGLVAVVSVALVLVFLTGPISYLPKAVLGAVIVAAATSLIDITAWRDLRETDRVEFAMAGVTFALVIVTGVLEAIAFMVALSIVDVVRRSARPDDAVLGWSSELDRYADIEVQPDAEVTAGVVVYRPGDRLFFANAAYVKSRVQDAIRAAPGTTHTLILDGEGITTIDATGIEALTELYDLLAGRDIELVFSRLYTQTQDHLIESDERFTPELFFPTVRAGVKATVRHGEPAGHTARPAGDPPNPGT